MEADIEHDGEHDRRGQSPQPMTSDGRTGAEKAILEAEQFKVSVNPPTGMGDNLLQFNNVERMSEFERFIAEREDDDFFHLTCHIEAGLRQRIERGLFVDLEKLLPRSRMQVLSADQHMQMVNRDGNTFWVPADKETRITNVRRWEQAFRVYAAIYCSANPTRAVEIWQYVYTINTAASSYTWENVAYYDFTFHQLMAEKPNRSWGRTYNQLWSLAMCDPLSKNSGSGQSSISSANNNQNSGNRGDWRDRCCWRFNKNEKCKKWNCRFDHRCSYCGSWSHASIDCPKKKGSRGYHEAGHPGRSGSPGHRKGKKHCK